MARDLRSLVTELIRSREILRLSQEVIRPFYQQKMARALDALEAAVRKFLAPKLVEVNLKALALGVEAVKA